MRTFLLLALLVTPRLATASEWIEDPRLEALFERAGLVGTFVLFNEESGAYTLYNHTRAETRFSPASTFKIPNSLIGLTVGAVRSVDEAIPYKGPEAPFIAAWKRDMGLREAITLSNVPIYQELARRIGLERMSANLKQLTYGNMETGASVDTFWLNGPLKISAIEQVQFLAALALGKLPFPSKHQQSVRDITLFEQGIDWALHAKTGWENAPGKGVGWWVGWVEKKGKIYSFALNIDMTKESDAAKRIQVGRSCLAVLEILPR